MITPNFVTSTDQTTDMFTKPDGPSLLKSSLIKLGIIDIFTPTWAEVLEIGNILGYS